MFLRANFANVNSKSHRFLYTFQIPQSLSKNGSNSVPNRINLMKTIFLIINFPQSGGDLVIHSNSFDQNHLLKYSLIASIYQIVSKCKLY